jgi:hypothetical protein
LKKLKIEEVKELKIEEVEDFRKSKICEVED